MMTAYFKQCSSPQQTKDLMRDLMMQFHPDRQPAAQFEHYNAITRDILEQYKAVLQGLDGYKAVNPKTGREWVYKYYPELEEKIQDKIMELISLNLPNDVTVTIVGLWVWVEGNHKPVKETLKAAKFIWHSGRKYWYWKPYKRHYGRTDASLESIKRWYGAEVVKAGQGSDQDKEDQGSTPALAG
jgi:hypothetical protein